MCPQSNIRHVLVLIMLYPVCVGCAKGASKEVERWNSCGPLALKTCLELVGQSVEAPMCADLANTTEQGVTTMQGLVGAARRLGQNARGMQLTERELAVLNRPAILHVSYPDAKDHFCVFASYRNGGFELIDPARGVAREMLSQEELSLLWDGKCVVFFRSPIVDTAKMICVHFASYLAVACGLAVGCCVAIVLRRRPEHRCVLTWGSLFLMMMGAIAYVGTRCTLSLESKHSLVFGTDVVDFGDVPVGTPMVRNISYANTGRGVIRIDREKTKASCSCVEVIPSEEVLRGGQEGMLSIHVSPRRHLGVFEYRVYLATHDKQKPQTLVVRGNSVGPGVAFPPRLYFSNVKPRQDVNRTVIYVPRYPTYRVLRVESSSPAVECSMVQNRLGFAMIGISLRKLPDRGVFSGTIRLIVKDPEEAVAEVPFEGIVTPCL